MALHFLADSASDAGPGDDVVLDGAEAHHAAAVRRIRVDEQVTVGDGRGAWLTGHCVAVSPREVVVRVDERTEIDPPVRRLVLVQALAKGDRDELAVQAATELGVDAIVPWQAERSVSRWDAKAAKGVARWSAIVREAAKQAHRAWVPEVADLARTADLVRLASGTRMLVLEPGAPEPLSGAALGGDGQDVVLIVGPEGGISPAESAALTAAGAQSVRLGDTVLRTSTAGAAALAVASVRLDRW
ncbi:16S rRNA (uracil(1498)-N(3))-methyltransferase [Microbacterium sp. P04]|uniref:16S rRNA (uracil(1498)-N(3))-methyltransferase n=1 Tax=Microbacterium sp. P04 TaxID=3366947 RepID=UPI0037452C34